MLSDSVHCMTELTASAPMADREARRRLREIFVVTALGAFMASLDLSIVNVAFPALERSFRGDTAASMAWVITGYSIVFGALLVVAGRTADRLGSRRVFFAGLAVFCLGSGLAGLAPTVPLLVAGRVIQGVGRQPSSRRRSVCCSPRSPRTDAPRWWRCGVASARWRSPRAPRWVPS